MYYVRTMEQRVNESACSATFFDDAAGSIRKRGAGSCHDWHLRGDGVPCQSGNSRARNSNCAWGVTRNILRLVVRQGMVLAFSGVAIGLVAAFLLVRLMRSMLFGVEVTDPITFTGISLLLAIIALLACYIPAQRAARIHPMISLRCD